jgi:hypothetical protein
MGGTHGAAEVIMIGDGEGMIAEVFSAQHQFFQRRGTVVEGIIAVAMKFSVHDELSITPDSAILMDESFIGMPGEKKSGTGKE